MNRLQNAIEHTWLPTHPLPQSDDAEDKLHQLCQEAITHQLGGVCVRPEHVKHVSKALDQTPVRLVSVAGFPTQKTSIAAARATGWGKTPLAEKLAEAQKALEEGANEIDWVINATVFDREWQTAPHQPEAWHDTRAEWQAALSAVTPHPLKLILETSLWSHAQIQGLCQLATSIISESPDATLFIKTCTGYLSDCQGATPESITLIQQSLGDFYPERINIKASGGIKTHAQAMTLLEAGATRLGTSNGLALLSPEGVLSGGY